LRFIAWRVGIDQANNVNYYDYHIGKVGNAKIVYGKSDFSGFHDHNTSRVCGNYNNSRISLFIQSFLDFS